MQIDDRLYICKLNWYWLIRPNHRLCRFACVRIKAEKSVQLRAYERANTKIKTAIKTKITKYRNENKKKTHKLWSTHKKWLVGFRFRYFFFYWMLLFWSSQVNAKFQLEKLELKELKNLRKNCPYFFVCLLVLVVGACVVFKEEECMIVNKQKNTF